MQNADLIFNKAKEAYEQSDLVNSSKLFEEYININPNNAEAYFFMGNIFHMKGQIGKAIKGFKKVLEIEPNHTEASISLSVLLNDIGRYDEAKKIFERANSNLNVSKEGVNDPQINRRFSLKHYELAEMYFSYGRYEESLFEYNKASGLDPDNLEIRIKIAKVYAKKGYNSKAQEVLRALKREYPGYLKAKIALGLVYYGLGNVIEAQNEWQGVLAKDPENKEARMYLDLSRNARETSLTSQEQMGLSSSKKIH